MRTYLKIFMCMLMLCFSKITTAQLQQIDSSFNIGNGANGTINNIDIQSHGKIIITGEFTNFNGTIKNRIARLSINGTTDQLFETGVGTQGPIRATALQSDDKLIIAGLFSTYNGGTVGNLARLNENAVIDTSFHTEIGANNEITEVFIQQDGKVLIAGFFNKYDNISNKGLVRLNSNGSIDTTFKIGNGTNLSPNVINQTRSNKLLLAGSFTSFNGRPVSKIIQLNLNGSLDTNFNGGVINGSITNICYDSYNDYIYIGGSFTSINNLPLNRVARLFGNGMLDTSYKANIVGTIRTMHLQKDKKLIVAGDFTSANGNTVKRIVTFRQDGTLDNNQFVGTNGTIYDIKEDSNRDILLSGAFTELNNAGSSSGIGLNRLSRIKNAYCVSAEQPIVDTHFLQVCKGDSFSVRISGKLNDDTQWYWYKDSLNGLLIDSGVVFKSVADTATTYYVRSNNVCNAIFIPNGYNHFHLYVFDSIGAQIIKTDKQLYVPYSPIAGYQWNFCDSILIPIQGETYNSITPVVSGNYLVEIFQNLCYKKSDCVYFPVVASGIETKKEISIVNPIRNELLINENYNIKELKVVSMLGEVVMYKKSNEILTNVDVEKLSTGVYMFFLKSIDGIVYQKRILKN